MTAVQTNPVACTDLSKEARREFIKLASIEALIEGLNLLPVQTA